MNEIISDLIKWPSITIRFWRVKIWKHWLTDCRIATEVDSHHQPVGRQHKLLSQLHRFHGNLSSISAINRHQKPCGKRSPLRRINIWSQYLNCWNIIVMWNFGGIFFRNWHKSLFHKLTHSRPPDINVHLLVFTLLDGFEDSFNISPFGQS